MPDFIAAQDGTITRDPGQASPDPARRPGQPGAQRSQVDDTTTAEAPSRPGETDERGDPVGDAPGMQAANDPGPDEANEAPASQMLSDGSVRAAPV
jgi:hypothetical protein